MSAPSEPKKNGLASFRVKLLVAMMLVASAATAIGLIFSQRNVAANAKRELERTFQGELAALHSVQEVRHAALAERCRALARKPRIHAALEDNALDLLYPSARDELLDVMSDPGEPGDHAAFAFHSRFYRFLDGKGAVISPPDAEDVGPLQPAEEALLALRSVPNRVQTGYLRRKTDAGVETIDEVIAMPIFSTETGDPIAALVLGFKPFDLTGHRSNDSIQSGILVNNRLQLPALSDAALSALTEQLRNNLQATGDPGSGFTVQIDGTPCLLFYKQLNPDSLFPPAYEVSIYPLTESIALQRRLFWQFLGAWLLLLLGALVASHFLSARLSVPVEKLAVDSEENRTQRKRVEAALELSHEELQRSARFSADASHQLKTPVTVLRVGLEELLAGEQLSAEAREEISGLVHQTFRLTSVIEDLLLLSRMDAGRLKLELEPVNLTQLIEASLDDQGALPDEWELKFETEFPPALHIEGERRYTSLILQNLLENARKYNRPGGRIRLTARAGQGSALLTIGNTGQAISSEAQKHIFDRFHRGSAGENVPGHGLGLNLARELARLHRGDLNLVSSDDNWTEFEVRFRLATVVESNQF